jgi:membrane protease YdiL (CAAX protease family)
MSPPPFGLKRALLILGAFLGVQLVVALVAGVYAGYRGARAQAVGDGRHTGPDLEFAIGAAVGGTVLAGLVVVRLIRRSGEGALPAVGWRAAPAGAVGRAVAQGVGLIVLLVLAASVLPLPDHALGPLAEAARRGGWTRAAWALLAVAIAPPTEELVFRGVLYAGLAEKWGPSIAAALTTAIFVGLHVTEIGAYWPAWLAIGLLGVLALRVRLETGSLLPAIALHATYNLGLVLATYAATQ